MSAEEAVPAVAGRLALTEAQADKFARVTDGMSLHAMTEIAMLAEDRRIADIGDAVRIYKLGVDDDPWRRTRVRDHIRKGELTIGGAVKGQQLAITQDAGHPQALGAGALRRANHAARPRDPAACCSSQARQASARRS